MAEDLRFTAELIDAMSAPLNAIADALIKVSDSMNAATQVFQQGFDASVKASEALQISMENLGRQVDVAAKNTADASKIMTNELVPALEETSTNLVGVEGQIKGLSDTLTTNTAMIEGNTLGLEGNTVAQQILAQQTNGLANTNNALGQNLADTTNALNDTTLATDNLQRTNAALNSTVGTLDMSVYGLTGRVIENTDAVIPNTDATVKQTQAAVDLTTVTATAASNVGDLTKVTVDQTAATTAQTSATLKNTDAEIANTAAVDALTKATSSGTTVVNNYSNSQNRAAKANADANASGMAGKGEREGGYGAILGATMLLGMAGAAARVGINLIKTGIDGEQALQLIASMTGATSEQLQGYTAQLEALAPIVGKTISDLAAGLYDITSVGYSGQAALDMLTVSAKAAAAGGSDLHTVTDGLTAVMKDFELGTDKAKNVTDQLLMGVRVGKAEFSDYAKAIGLVGLVSHQAHFSMEETNAALATMTVVYHSTKQAGQNLQHLIQALGIEFQKVEKRADGAGIALNHTKFESEGLRDRLMDLWTASGHNSTKFRELVGDATSFKAAMALLDGGMKDYDTNIEAMKHASDGLGATQEAFNVQAQTMKMHLQQLTAAFSVLGLNIAKIAAPLLNATLGLLVTIFSKLNAIIAEHQSVALPVLITLAGIIAGLLVGAIAALSAILLPMMASAAAIAVPFSIAGGALAAFGVAVKKAYDSSPELRAALGQLGTAVRGLAAPIGALLMPALHSLAEFVGGLGSKLGTLFGHTEKVTGVMFHWETVTRNVNGHLVTTHQRVEEFGQKLTFVRGPLSFVIDAIKHLTDFIHSLTQKLNDFLHPVQSMAGGLREAYTGLHRVSEEARPVGDTVHNVSQRVKEIDDRFRGLVGPTHTVAQAAKDVDDHFRALHGHVKPLEETIHRLTEKITAHRGQMLTLKDVLHNIMGVLGPLAGAFGIVGTIVGGMLFMHSMAFVGVLFKLHTIVTPVINFVQLLASNMRWLSVVFNIIVKSTSGWSGVLNILSVILKGGLVPMLQSLGASIVAVLVPLGIIIAVIAAVAAVVVSVVWSFQHWYKTSEAFRNIVAAVIDQLKSIGSIIMANVKPVIDQLGKTFKENLLPAWKSMQDGFNQAKPLMQIIAAIVGGVLLVALALLIGVIKGLAQGIGGLLVGIIKFIGGIVQAFAGLFQFFMAFWGGIVHILNDLLTGHLDRIPGHAIQMFNGMKDGVLNVLKGLGTAILGLLQGLWNGISGLLSGLVTGFIGFFAHIFEKLVGHSIVVDTVLGIVMWIAKLPIMIPIELLKVVAHFLGIFGGLLTKGPKIMGDVVHGVVGKLAGLVTGGVPHVAKLATDAVKHLGTMELDGIKHIGSLAQQGLGLFNNMADQISGKAQLEREKVALEHQAMKVQSLTHIQAMHQQALGHFEQMRSKILDELAHTKDGAKRHALEMQLGVVDQHIQMEKNAVNATAKQKNDALKHMEEMKLKAQQHAKDMNSNVVSQAVQMGQNFVNNVASMATNVGTKVKSMADDIVKKITDIGGRMKQAGINLIQSLIDGIGSMLGNVANAAGNIAKTIGDHLHFGSPTKEGEGKTVMQWMPNLVNQLAGDLEHGESKVGTSAAKIGAAIRKQIVQGTSGAGAGTGALLGSGTNPNAKQEVHLHLDGGLGAGLQLLNPADRRRFARQIAEEMGKSMSLQGRLDNGYSGF
ncbi:MAG: phage tail tape measure protein [Ktedonobacterales bacterium]